MRLTLTCLLLSLTLPASAAIYKYTDAKGNIVYTNQAPAGTASETVNLPTINTVEMKAPAADASDGAASKAAPDGGNGPYESLKIGNLPSEEALRANNGTFSVTISAQPPLLPGHTFRVLLDGKPYGPPTSGTNLQLNQIDRGDHNLVVQVLSGDQVIQQGAPTPFTVQRVSTTPPPAKPTPKSAP
ncbi:MAG: DUF4124 domain-containing protein [Pseudomonas sp.]|uniref:DUF4124 domain-containing protein n=1 Tax=Pseudomonas sp. TaxID=306 RepID=UPI003393F246